MKLVYNHLFMPSNRPLRLGFLRDGADSMRLGRRDGAAIIGVYMRIPGHAWVLHK